MPLAVFSLISTINLPLHRVLEQSYPHFFIQSITMLCLVMGRVQESMYCEFRKVCIVRDFVVLSSFCSELAQSWLGVTHYSPWLPGIACCLSALGVCTACYCTEYCRPLYPIVSICVHEHRRGGGNTLWEINSAWRKGLVNKGAGYRASQRD